MKRTKSLATVTLKELCRLRRDGADWKDWRISTDSYSVWLKEQAMGEAPKQLIQIPRGIFNRLIRQYLRERREVPHGE